MTMPGRNNLQELFATIGIAGPLPYLPDEEAPPIDEYLLAALADGELVEEDADVVWGYVASFLCWENAYRAVLNQCDALSQHKEVQEVSAIGGLQRDSQKQQNSQAEGGGTAEERATAVALEELLHESSGLTNEGTAPSAAGTVNLAGSTVIAPPPVKVGIQADSELVDFLIPVLRDLRPAIVQLTESLQGIKQAQTSPGIESRSRRNERWVLIGFGLLFVLMLLVLLALTLSVRNAMPVSRRGNPEAPQPVAQAEREGEQTSIKAEMTGLRQEIGQIRVGLGQSQQDLQAIVHPPEKHPLHRDLVTIRGHREAVTAVSFLPSGKRLATASIDGSISLWDLSDRQEREVATFNTFSPVRQLAVIGDGRWLAGASEDGMVSVWDVETKHLLINREGLAIARMPAGNTLTVVSKDGLVRILELPSGNEKSQFRIVPEKMSLAAVSFAMSDKAGLRLAIAFKPAPTPKDTSESEYRTVQFAAGGWQHEIWDISTGKKMVTLRNGTYKPGSCACSPDGAFLVLNVPQLSMPVAGISRPQTEMIWYPVTPKKEEVGQETHLLEMVTGRKLKSFSHEEVLRCICISSDAMYIIGGTVKGNLMIWDVSSGKLVHKLRCHHSPILSVAIKADSNQIATAGGDGLVRLWDFKALRDTRHGDDNK